MVEIYQNEYTVNLSGSRGSAELLGEVGGSEPAVYQTNDGDTSYLFMRSTFGGTESSFSYAPLDNISEAEGVYSVTVKFVCRDDAGPTVGNACAAIFISGESPAFGSANTLTGSYVTYEEEWVTSPWSGSPWTAAQINSLQVGVKLETDNQVSQPVRCTQVFGVVKTLPLLGGVTISNGTTMTIAPGNTLKLGIL